MKILVTNDDGILAEGLWALVKELKNIAQVVVVAPDRERSGIGTAITLNQPLRVRRVRPIVPEIEAYSVKGTPADSVILALEKLVKNKIGLVISGINGGANLGHDSLVSGTVGAALQGYLRGFSSLAVSVSSRDSPYLDDAAKVAVSLAEKIATNALPSNIFLNVNLPDLPLAKMRGVKVTHLVNEGHIGTVKEGHDGKREYYCLVPQKKINKGKDRATDVWAVKQGNISITPLHAYFNNESSAVITDGFCSEILDKLRKR